MAFGSAQFQIRQESFVNPNLEKKLYDITSKMLKDLTFLEGMKI